MTEKEDIIKVYDDVINTMRHLTEFREQHNQDTKRSARIESHLVTIVTELLARVEYLEVRVAALGGDENAARIIN